MLVIGCGDSYVQLAARYKDQMPANAIAPYIPGDLLDHLINKEYFYKLCDRHGIDHPATVIYDKSMGHDFDLPWDPPYIAKPADGVAYWQHEFEGIKKVYICQSRQELLDALDAVYAAGYPDHMILQEFIPGDDTYMRVLTNYSDRNAQVKLMCLGHVLLEEHSPHGIGNHAVIITEHDEALCLKIKALLESLHYVGFSNFDIKYDSRDGKYKLFEINCRQGRSNYYVTGAGYNIAKLLVEDLVEQKELPFVITENESLWRMVPKAVAFKFVPKSYHPRMKALLKKGRPPTPWSTAGTSAPSASGGCGRPTSGIWCGLTGTIRCRRRICNPEGSHRRTGKERHEQADHSTGILENCPRFCGIYRSGRRLWHPDEQCGLRRRVDGGHEYLYLRRVHAVCGCRPADRRGRHRHHSHHHGDDQRETPVLQHIHDRPV